jgi:RNA polymerase sigma-70 factor (ECF subfamily)
VAIINELDLEDFQYLHAARPDLLSRLGRTDEARGAYRRALSLVPGDADRRLWERRIEELD